MELNKLLAPFHGNQIHFRVGATNLNKNGTLKWDNRDYPGQAVGIPLAYLDARDVMERLDKVCGTAGWQAEYPFPGCCRIGIQTAYETKQGAERQWIWKANGAGETDVEGQKGMYSDAFKRAAVLWGVGRYLYDMPNIWMPIDPKKRVFTRDVLKELHGRYDVWVDNYFKKQE